jgi:putative intracellular protease/amidase/YHS domain-containing protein
MAAKLPVTISPGDIVRLPAIERSGSHEPAGRVAMNRDGMSRRELLQGSTALGVMATMPVALVSGKEYRVGYGPSGMQGKSGDVVNPLKPPANGGIPAAFVISQGAVMIDFAGPWEVFESAIYPSAGMLMGDQMPFYPYLVAERLDSVETSGGMKVLPRYTFSNAPTPKVIVIPAQDGASEAMFRWIREQSKQTDVTMSVCTGAFVLAKTGLLNGKRATTHHSGYVQLALEYPDIHVMPGYRFVEEGNIATAGGLTSGIDLALRVVERYYGRTAAEETVYQLEYQGQGWLDATGQSNQAYQKARGGMTCPICGMAVVEGMSPKLEYKGKTYYFCMTSHRDLFQSAPDKVLKMMAGEES